MNIQKLVSENIKARGYYEGHEPVPLLARHVAKLQEELGELGFFFVKFPHDEFYSGYFAHKLAQIRDQAEYIFDQGDWSKTNMLTSGGVVPAIKSELADLQVVILSMAQIINDNFGEYDVLQAALEKSQKDIKRGVR